MSKKRKPDTKEALLSPEEQIRKLNRTLLVLSGINRAIVHIREPLVLFRETCRIAVDVGGLRMAWIGMADAATGRVDVVASSGVTDGYLEKLNIVLNDEQRGRGPTGAAIREGRNVICNDVELDERMGPWREDALRLGYRSSAAFPLKVLGAVTGSLNLYSDKPDYFDDEEIKLLNELVMDLSFAMEYAEQEARRLIAENALRLAKRDWENIFQSIGSPVLIIDTNHNILAANRFALDLTGGTETEIAGRKCHALLHGTDQPAKGCPLVELLKSGSAISAEMTIEMLGRVFFITCTPALDDAGNVEKVIHVSTDITERVRMENALRESEERFRRALENIPDVVVIYDRDLRIQYINNATLRVTGRPASDFIGRREEEVWPPEVYEVWLPTLREAIETRTICSIETDLLMPETGLRSLSITCVPLIDEKGEVREVLGITHDFTEHKRAEKTLADEAIRRRILVEQSRDGIVVMDEDGKVYEANKRFAEMLGYSGEEVLQLHVWDWDTRWTREQLLEMLRLVDVSGDHFETRHRRKDGTFIDVEVSSNGAVCAGKKLVFAVCRNISERKMAEQALREKERLLSESQRIAHIGSWEINTESGSIIWSDEMYNIYGISPDVFKHDEEAFLKLLHPDDRSAMEEWIADCYAGKKPGDLEFRIIQPDGNIRWINGRGEMLFDNENKPCRFIGTAQDITAHKRMEIRQKLLVKIIEILNSANNTANIIHDVTIKIREHFDIEAVGVRLRSDEDYPYFIANGFPEKFREAENYLCERDLDGRLIRDNEGHPVLDCMCGNVICGRFDPAKPFFTAKGSFWSNCTTELLASTTEADRQARTRNRCNSEGYESVALIPLNYGDETIGLLQLNDRRPNRFDLDIIHFIEEIGLGIGVAISKKSAEEKVARTAQEWQTTFDSTGDAIWVIDEDNRVLRANKFSELLFQRPCGDIVGKSCCEIVHGTAQLLPECPVLRTKKSLCRETVDFQIGGHWFNVSVDPVLNADRQYSGAVHIVRDITERKRIEAALRESEENFRILFETSHDAIMTLEPPAWKFASCNPATVEMFMARNADEFATLGPWELSPERQPDGQDSEEKAREMIETALREGAHLFEWTHKRLDGVEFPASVLLSKVNIAGKVFLQATVRDITEQKRTEEALRQSEEQFQQAQKMEAVGRLAGGVAHDFNNMLAVIIGNAQLAMLDVDTTEPIYKDLQEIFKAGERSADLTRQLLAFARKQTVSPIVIDLNKSVPDMLKMLQRLIGEDIDLSWRPGHKTWTVKIDPSQVDQILANLMVNARDAIAGVGKVTIETENTVIDEAYCAEHAETTLGEYVMLSVSDNGCGMEKDVLQHIFEPFFTTKETGKGTGLGLATVYGAVKQNNGFINVYSEPGEGTTFNVYLPRFAEEGGEATAKAEPQTLLTGTETVLIVEDEPAILNLGKRFLEGLGYTVMTAETPMDAIHQAEKYKGVIHLLLTDVVMPEMTGREVAKQLGAARPSLKCLYMSGYTADVIAHHGVLDAGVRFVQKPFSLNDLSRKVREALDG